MAKYYRILLIVLLFLPLPALRAQGGSMPNSSSFRSTSIMRTEPVQSAGTSYRPTGSFRPSSTQYGSTPAVTGHKSPITRPTAAQPVYGSKVMPGQAVSSTNGTTGTSHGPRKTLVYDPELEDYVEDGTAKEGDTQIIGGIPMIYTGGKWVRNEGVTIPTEFTPVGNMPWVLMLCAALIYMLVVKYKKNRYEI